MEKDTSDGRFTRGNISAIDCGFRHAANTAYVCVHARDTRATHAAVIMQPRGAETELSATRQFAIGTEVSADTPLLRRQPDVRQTKQGSDS